MSRSRTHLRLASVVLLALATLLSVAPAHADTRVMPGSFTGYAFDTASAPTQEKMDAWRESSPFWGVGIYIAGRNRYDGTQANLTPSWVAEQSRKGWRILPIMVGLQASCFTKYHGRDDEADRLISADPAKSYAKARVQGRSEARGAVTAAKRFGIAAGSTLWYDIEHFDISNDDCRRSTLTFLSAWTKKVRALGYRSGVYSSASSGIAALDRADELAPGAYAMPDQIWVGWGNGRANTYVPSSWLRSTAWAPHARVHQYRLDVYARYGGVRMKIDRDFMDVGRGSVAPRPLRHCGVQVDFPRYRIQKLGKRNGQVAAAQCLLRHKRVYRGAVNGRFTRATYRAVKRFQRTHALPLSGTMSRRTWTALLSDGRRPLMKYGSASESVRRVQRALNATPAGGLPVTGLFAQETTAAVKRYQVAHKLPGTGVVTPQLWTMLQRGTL